MEMSLFLLAILLASPSPSFSEPSGKLGCRFSPVCEEDELCAEDKLFGTCTQRSANYLPSYDLSPTGLKRLKDVVQYLLDQGFAWEDQYAQDSLREVLHPFKQNIIPVTPDLQPPGYQPQPSTFQEEAEAWTNVDQLAEAYQAIVAEYKQRYDAYTELVNQYGFGDDAELNAYAEKMRRRYNQIIRDLQAEQEENLRKLYDLYYQKYLTLLKSESEARLRVTKPQEDAWGAYEDGSDWKGLYKLQLFKEYLQLLYNENRDRWAVPTNEVLDSVYPSSSEYSSESYFEDWAGDISSEMLGGDGSAAIETESVESLAEGTDGKDDTWDAVLGNLNPEYWNSLTEEEKNKVIDEFLQLNVNDADIAEATGEMGAEEGVLKEKKDGGEEPQEDKMPKTPQEEDVTLSKEDFWDVVLSDLNGNYWDSLTEEEKQRVIDEFLEFDISDEDVRKVIEEVEREDGGVGEMGDGAGGGGEHQGDEKQTTDKVEEAETSKGQGIGEPGKEFVEPLKQPKESGIKLDDVLAKKDKDAVATVTPKPAGKDQTEPAPTTSKRTTFAPSGYVTIALQSGISLRQAQMLVEELGNALNAPEGSFTEIETGEKQVTFKVNPDVVRMTPAEVAKAAAAHQSDLESMMGVQITQTGVGKQTHITVLDAPQDDNSTLIIVTVVLVACIIGILIAVITVYCYRQKARFRAKVKGLSANGGAVEGEATADYQDLCRQRMASKSSEKPEPLSRISSVAMSEGAVPSPSSRSSTSSWSEEPVQSNMDISTGHIVLSYMEDHLRNKDRITKEWDALCRYEPDISSTKVGALPANSSKNRYQDVLPYDHTRVFLNDSTNALSSDYINASTIADADPRNPAYIATQAPLPSTVADFWQMVWEQGAVVIVNLTPMTDTDSVHTLYWPTEGGTRYHFYEVHLVSEHVWCDDYLVRSFYLKNTETQETRTVTQFHFLTWPENGIPPSPKALLEFRRKVNKSYRGKASPIVVHCSDGVGRTGTYCLVDMVLTRMTKGAKEIDIAATLEHIRDQRPGAVKLKEQFEFALTALAEEVNAILKALPQ